MVDAQNVELSDHLKSIIEDSRYEEDLKIGKVSFKMHLLTGPEVEELETFLAKMELAKASVARWQYTLAIAITLINGKGFVSRDEAYKFFRDMGDHILEGFIKQYRSLEDRAKAAFFDGEIKNS